MGGKHLRVHNLSTLKNGTNPQHGLQTHQPYQLDSIRLLIESRKKIEINTFLSIDSYCPVTVKVNGHGMSKVLRLLPVKILKDTYFTRLGEVEISNNICPRRKHK